MSEQIMVSIPKKLYWRVKQLAGRQNQDVNEVLAKTLAAALPPEEENLTVWAEPDEAVERERQAYIAMHPLLKEKVLGMHVAIYHGQLIDQDKDMDALYARIDRQYPDEFVWITAVAETPLRTLEFRSPRFVREQPMPFTYEYDTSYDPAMPAVEVLIGRALDAADLPLTAIVDSGADATIIPLPYLRQIRARKGGQAWMRGTVGARVRVDLYQISLQLGEHKQGRVEVVGGSGDNEVILGRDVLNHLEVMLNGPAHTVLVTQGRFLLYGSGASEILRNIIGREMGAPKRK